MLLKELLLLIVATVPLAAAAPSAMADELEDIIHQEGAVPATIGVVDGVATVGLDAHELEIMACTPGIPKLSMRDSPIARAKRCHGATTVAGTAHLAAAGKHGLRAEPRAEDR